MLNVKRKLKTFTLVFIFLVMAFMLLPMEAGASAGHPDFSKIDGKIEGFMLPITRNIYSSVDQPTPPVGPVWFWYGDSELSSWHIVYGDRDQESDLFREIRLEILFYPDEVGYSFNPADYLARYKVPIFDHLPAGNYRLIENSITQDSYSFAFEEFEDPELYVEGWLAHGWKGQRSVWLNLQGGTCRVQVTGRGTGWNDADFKRAFDMAEQYARDALGEEEASFSLVYYQPFEFFETEVIREKLHGNIRAELKDANGDPVKSKIVFYIEPGSTLSKVIRESTAGTDLHILNLIGRDKIFLGGTWSDNNGVAWMNYHWPSQLKMDDMVKVLKEDGKIEGTIHAVSIDGTKIKHRTSVDVEHEGFAKIVRIRGAGWPEDYKEQYSALNPEARPWREGRVRVMRPFIEPHFDFVKVEDNFILMPGDAIEIDGGVEVEILWANGDRVIARVPKEIEFKHQTLPNPFSRIILMATAHESGFESPLDRFAHAVYGLSIEKAWDYAVDLAIKLSPKGKAAQTGGKMIVNVYKKMEDRIDDSDFSDHDLITKIRIRSLVRINSLDEGLQVQVLEGSPDIITATGDEITLNNLEMVNISLEGVIGDKTHLNPAVDMSDWADTIAEWAEDEDIISLKPFSDLSSQHWAYGDIMEMVEKGILRGYPDGNFKPNNTITRAEFARIMVLALKLGEESPPVPTFSDVGREHWAFGSVEAAKDYLEGTQYASTGKMIFNPGGAALREDVAAAIVKAKGFGENAANLALLEQFPDRGQISPARRDLVSIAVEKNYMRGTDRGFEPGKALTRAEACTLLARLMKLEPGQGREKEAFEPGHTDEDKESPSGKEPVVEHTGVEGVLGAWQGSQHDDEIYMHFSEDGIFSAGVTSEGFWFETDYILEGNQEPYLLLIYDELFDDWFIEAYLSLPGQDTLIWETLDETDDVLFKRVGENAFLEAISELE